MMNRTKQFLIYSAFRCFIFVAILLFCYAVSASSQANHIVISQFSYNSPSASDDDWVEIHNPTDHDIDLTGMSLQVRIGATSFKKTNISGMTSNVIKAGGYFLFVKDDSATQQCLKDMADQLVATSCLDLAQSGSNGRTIYLVSNGTTLTIETDSGATVIDRVAYGSGGSAMNPEGTALGYQTAAAFERKPGTPNANGQDADDNSADFKTVTTIDSGRSNVPGYPRNSQSAVEPRSVIPPCAISDLTALTDNNSESKVRLKWTAPGADGTAGMVRGYVVNYTTINVIRKSPTVNFSTVTASQISYFPSTLVSAGNSQIADVTGLPAGVVIYFRVRGYDDSVLYGVWNSSMDVAAVNTLASTTTLDLAPNAPTNFVAGASNTAVNLSWTLSDSADTDSYEISYSTNSNYLSASTVTVSKSSSAYCITGLTNQVAYYFRIRTVDDAPSLKSDFAAVSATPNLRPPTSLSAVHRDTSVHLSWAVSVDDQVGNFNLYNLRRGLSFGGPYSVLAGAFSAATTSYIDTNGIVPGVTYYYTIYSSGSATLPAVSGNQIEGSASNEAVALPDIMPPEINCSQTNLLNYSGTPLTVRATVTDYCDAAKTSSGAIQTVRLYYQIMKSTAPLTCQSMSPSPTGSHTYSGSAQIPASAVLEAATAVSSITYFVTAYDGTNISTSVVVSLAVVKPEMGTIGTEGGILSVSFPDGGQLELDIPPGSLSVPTPITVMVFDDNNPAPTAKNESNIDLSFIPSGKPLSAYEFGPDGLSFTVRPTIKLYYPPTAIDKDKLKVFLREGNKWTNQGGQANDQNQVVFKPHHFSKYAVFPSKPSSQKTTEKKFITPNGDGRNDSTEWSEAIKEVMIFDITGCEIWNAVADQSSKETIQWNGKNRDGIIVEGGAYIYRAVAINGEIAHGVIVVIK